MSAKYRPDDFSPLAFHTHRAAFESGSDTPRAYLERCLETIAARESVVRAWVALNESGARAQADASTQRWRSGRRLSDIDGSPSASRTCSKQRTCRRNSVVRRLREI